MTLLNKIKLYYYKKKIEKFTDDLCYHMFSVCDYFHSNNSTVQTGDLIKEAISLIGTWDRVSENLFKHKVVGISIEVRKTDSLAEATRLVLKIEIDNLTKNLSKELSEILQNNAMVILDKNLSERQSD